MGLLDFLKNKDAVSLEKEVSKWIDAVLPQNIPEEVAAFCFNLYDDGDGNWSMELVGTQCFDADDTDWPCDEITNFGTRKKMFHWNSAAKWEMVLDAMIVALKAYLKNGKCAKLLKSQSGVGVGFVDGDVKILYTRSV